MQRLFRTASYAVLSLVIALLLGGTAVKTLSVRAAVPPRQATPPVVVSTEPAADAPWMGEPVRITFDQAMDPASADYLTVTPALAGATRVEDAAVIFTPAAEPEAGRRYEFTLRTALSADGTEVNAPVVLILNTPVPLQVLNVTATDENLTVLFNQPVVALGSEETPRPFKLEPDAAGQGEWVTTSAYVFTPESGFDAGSDYQVTVDNVNTFDGIPLAQPYQTSFTTGAPAVSNVSPQALGGPNPPDAPVTITFTKPMDQASVEAGFSLRPVTEGDAPGQAVAGGFTWNDDSTTVTFTPDASLGFDQEYVIGLMADVQSARGSGNLGEPVAVHFRTFSLPAIDYTESLDGNEGVPLDAPVAVYFTAPLSYTLALDAVDVTPVPTTTTVISYYSDYPTPNVQLIWPKEPQTAYTVTVDGAAGDAYGNTLGKEFSFSFTTGDYPPAVQTDLENFTHFTAFTTTVVAAYYRNVATVDAALYRLPPAELYKLAGPDQWQAFDNYAVPDEAANRIWERSYPSQVAANELGTELIKLQDDAGSDLPPGIYALQIARPVPAADTAGGAPATLHDTYVIILSNYNLVIKQSQTGASLAWLTDLATGEPVAQAPVEFRSDAGVLAWLRSTPPLSGRTPVEFRSDADVLAQGVTDAAGLVTVQAQVEGDNAWQPVLAVSGAPGDPIFAVASTEWSQGIAAWDFNLPSGYGQETMQTFFYTDRPVYRPGDRVNWKGILRMMGDDGYRLPSQETRVDITVRNDRGDEIQRRTVRPNAHGTVSGFIDLADEATTGYYYVEALVQTGTPNPVYAGTGFQVAAYRKPEFEITFTPEKDEYIQGETVRVAVDAAYYSGGPLADAPVTWRILSSPYDYRWEDGPQGRYYSFAAYDPTTEDYDPYRGFSLGELIREGAGVTDAQGRYVIEAPAELAAGMGSQSLQIDVTVQSATDQFVSNQVNVPVHQSAFAIGISPERYVVSVGEEATIDLVTLESLGAPHSAPYPGAELDVVIYEFRWNSVYAQENGVYVWKTSVDRTPVYSETVTTGRDGMAAVSFTPAAAGQYQITAAGVDAEGRISAGAGYLYAAGGSDFVAWPRENNNRIELVADKQTYAPGDTAEILVPSPFTGPVQALVTIERGGVIDARVVTLASNSATLEIPVTADAIPNIYVSVILLKGVDESNPFPAMAVGMTELAVDVREKELTITVDPGAETVAPGTQITYTIDVADVTGAPVADAELSVALIDKAIFALGGQTESSLADVFYARRPLGVRTGALLVINEDQLSRLLAEGPKGGGGGGGGISMLEVREDFRDAAYWDAELVTDDAGQASFSVTLPENLTTWVLVVRGASDDTKVGDSRHELVATQDLQIRPALPRFFTAGDRAQIGAVVMNTTDERIAELRLQIGIEGADAEGETGFVTELDAGGQARFDLPVTVMKDAEEVTFTFTATSSVASDAVRITLPVVRYQTPETVATAGEVPPTGRVEAIRVPDGATDDGELSVTIEPSLAAGMLEGLDYLEHYPYECNEQAVSRFLPNLFTRRALRELGVEDAELAQQLAYQMGVGVQKLVNRQNPDGGWGYWPGEESSAYVSAYVLWGLAEAERMEYAVPQDTLDRAVGYLERQFQAPDAVANNWELNEMAFMHFVLAEMGQGDPGRAATLYDARARLAYYGKAYLAMALADMNDDADGDPRIETLLDELYGAVQTSATGASWHEADVDYMTLNTDLRTTAIVLTAFTRLDPDQPLLGNAVRWLMSARESGRWATTQENAWSIIALTDWLAATGELEADYAWDVSLNEAELGGGQVTPETVDTRTRLRAAVSDLLRDETNILRLSRDNASGRMYYTASLRTYVDAPAVSPRNRGIAVTRRFAAADGETISRAAVGDVISVTATIVAPKDLYHLLVEVPLPAGTEPVNASLATESAGAQGPQMEDVTDSSMPWRYWIPTATDMRDEKVALFATYLPAGTYQYTFQVRAALPGEYRVLPVHAEEMYFPEVWGRSGGEVFVVEE